LICSESATRSEDGRSLVLQAVNPTDKPVAAPIHIEGFAPTQPTARVIDLSGPLDAVNTAAQPQAIVPQQKPWNHGVRDGDMTYTFPAHSVQVLSFE
jgi:alpha-L-arabinofuranosidase